MTDWDLNAASFLGIAVLSIPVWRLNRNKRILQNIRDALETEDEGSLRESLGRIAAEKQGDEVATWRWWHEACLWIGYLLLLGSALLRLTL